MTAGYTQKEAAFSVHGERLQHGLGDRKTFTIHVFALFICFDIYAFFQYQTRSQLCYKTVYLFQMLFFLIKSQDILKDTF